MTETLDLEREARMTLAALSEPNDILTGTLVGRLGATVTLDIVTNGERLPNGVDPAEGELWRRRLAPRMNPDHVERIRADMERHDLHVLTPDDLDCPANSSSSARAHHSRSGSRATPACSQRPSPAG